MMCEQQDGNFARRFSEIQTHHEPTSTMSAFADINKFTDDDLALFKSIFSLYDTTSSGTIKASGTFSSNVRILNREPIFIFVLLATLADLGEMVRALNFTPTDDELQSIQVEYERNSGGLIDFRGFIRILGRSKKDPTLIREAELKEMLSMFEKVNNPGYLVVREMRQILASLGERFSPEEIQLLDAALHLQVASEHDSEASGSGDEVSSLGDSSQADEDDIISTDELLRKLLVI
jgi:Ca2+-binding EF-hand superfamily protein